MRDTQQWLSRLDALEPDERHTSVTRASEPHAVADPTARGARKVGVVLVALAISAAAGVLIWRALRPVPDQPAAARAESSVEVTCRGSAVELSSSSVEARSDGVHLLVAKSPAEYLSASFKGGGGSIVVPLGGEVSSAFPPGRVALFCGTEGQLPGDPQQLTVVDPRAYFVPLALDCSAQVSLDVSPPEAGESAMEAVERDLGSMLRPSDQVEMAGYPDAVNPAVRVVREGKIVASVQFVAAGDHLLSGEGPSHACESFVVD